MGVTLAESFPRQAVRLGVHAVDWRDAVRQAGCTLVETGAASDRYVDAIVAAVEELGPYIVLAPGIAIAHARPDDGATAVGFGLVGHRPRALRHPRVRRERPGRGRGR